MRNVGFPLIATFAAVAALALAGCGGDGDTTSAPTQATPVPTSTPIPTATDQASGGDLELTPTPAATSTAPSGSGTGGAEAGEDEGGDEAGNRVPVAVTVGAARIRASKDVVPAFLALRFTVTSRLDRDVEVVVVQSGEGGSTVGRGTLPAGGSVDIDTDGLQPGSLEVLSPDLDPDMTAIVRIEPGAG